MSGQYSQQQQHPLDYFSSEPINMIENLGDTQAETCSSFMTRDNLAGVRRSRKILAQSRTGARPKRGQANKRERVRTENVNAGFEKLRELIPTDPIDRKLSKIEILRLATSYINHLYNLTRANSCLEAEEIDRQQVGPKATESNVQDSQSKQKIHVCTFCLMLTKCPPAYRKR